MSIPVIDFSALHNGTKEERTELAYRVTDEFKKHGATRLKNHGISGESKVPLPFLLISMCHAAT